MASKPKRRRRPVYGPEARKIIARVGSYLKEEYKFLKATNHDSCHLTPLARVRQRTAEAVGVSTPTVTKIIEEENEEFKFNFSEFTRDRNCVNRPNNIDALSRLYSYDLSPYILRSLIYNYIAAEKNVPSVATLRNILISAYGFTGTHALLRSLLLDVGFTLYKTDFNSKGVLAEKHFIKMQRFRYLKQNQQYRLENRPIVYTGASVAHTTSDGTCYTTVFAGTENGLLANSYALYKEPNLCRGRYESWITEKLLPSLPENSVVVVGHEPYNDKLLNIPTVYSKKEEIVMWLENHSIPFDETLHKLELYDLFRKNKDKFLIYKTDRCINDAGFTVLRTPTKHPELNAIVTILEKIKTNIKTCPKLHYSTFLDSDAVEKIIKNIIDITFANKWKEIIQNVKEIENGYLNFFDNELHFNMNWHEEDDDDEVSGNANESDSEKTNESESEKTNESDSDKAENNEEQQKKNTTTYEYYLIQDDDDNIILKKK